MAFLDYLAIVYIAFPVFVREIWWRTTRLRILTRYRWTKVADGKDKEVVIIGASFGGVETAKQLRSSAPKGVHITIIDPRSEFHWCWNFPRFAVLRKDLERTAFLPYQAIFDSVKDRWKDRFRHLCATVQTVGKDSVQLSTGEKVKYDFLVFATGTTQPPPAHLQSQGTKDACLELKAWQARIRAAHRIAVIGGGAVGVEVAADIKTYLDDKDVTLIHSHDRLLNRFGPRLHRHVYSLLIELGVQVQLAVRPKLPAGDDSACTLTMKDGTENQFDLIIPCIGQKPNSSVPHIAGCSIDPQTARVNVLPTLQVQPGSDSEGDRDVFSRMYALGDVAQTGAPQMGRAAHLQARTVAANLMDAICGRPARTIYSPDPSIEGALKLTIGKDHSLLYTQSNSGKEILIEGAGRADDLEIDQAWKLMGVKLGTSH